MSRPRAKAEPVLYAFARRRLQSIRAMCPTSDIDLPWILARLAPMTCEATGMPLRLPVRLNDLLQPSIDRVDQNRPHQQDNCRVTSYGYNVLRNHHDDQTVDEWLDALERTGR